MTQDLLAVRRHIKNRKPNFLREDYDKKSLGLKWRRPTGRHSKIKHQFKGSRKMPSCGYRSPVAVRGLTRHGYVPVVVYTMADLERVNPKTDTVIIGSTVGNRKRALFLAKIIEKNLRVHNVRDTAASLKAINDGFKAKKKEEKKTAQKETPAVTKTEAAPKEQAPVAQTPASAAPAVQKAEAQKNPRTKKGEAK
ncbi:hypothetical protein HY639_03280 [Candidatus Woesearchaeota archaeon]|nr:hypothetical protein [Candidatus Woesearchaeota archaeon]